MTDYRPPNWRDAIRVYAKALRIVVEPGMVGRYRRLDPSSIIKSQ